MGIVIFLYDSFVVKLRTLQLLYSFSRLLSYNPETLVVQELATDLAFANGLAISSDKTHILVAETVKARIMR